MHEEHGRFLPHKQVYEWTNDTTEAIKRENAADEPVTLKLAIPARLTIQRLSGTFR